jgi:hypothetical protein
LDVICFAHLFNHQAMKPEAKLSVPSWVPDWRAKVKQLIPPVMASQSARGHIGNFRPIDRLSFKAAYAAAGVSLPQVIISTDLRTLTCQGIFVDGIDGIGGLKEPFIHWTGEEVYVEQEYPCVQSTSSKYYYNEPNDGVSTSDTLDADNQFHLLESIARCLVLDREDRYLCNSAPRGRFSSYFQGICLAAMETPKEVHALFLDWFQRNRTLRIQGRPLEALLRTTRISLTSLLRTTRTLLLSNAMDFMRMVDKMGFLARFRDTIKEMARRLTVTDQGHVGMDHAEQNLISFLHVICTLTAHLVRHAYLTGC